MAGAKPMQFVFAYRGSGELETLAGVNHVLSGPIAAHDSCRQATHLPILLTPGMRGELFYSSLCFSFIETMAVFLDMETLADMSSVC